MTNPEDAFDDTPTNVLRKYDIFCLENNNLAATGVSAPSAAAAAQQWLEATAHTPSELPDKIVVYEIGASFSTTFKVVPQVRAVPVE